MHMTDAYDDERAFRQAMGGRVTRPVACQAAAARVPATRVTDQ